MRRQLLGPLALYLVGLLFVLQVRARGDAAFRCALLAAYKQPGALIANWWLHTGRHCINYLRLY